MSSPSALVKVNYQVMRYLHFESVRGDLQELRHEQTAAAFAIQRLRPWLATASSSTRYLRPRPGSSLIGRRYGGGVGNRCRWAERFAMSEQIQSMERHFQRSRELFRTDRGRPCPVNGRHRKRSAAGGWSEAEVCAEEWPLRGRPCMEDNAAAAGSSCELANPAQVRQIASQTEVLFSAR